MSGKWDSRASRMSYCAKGCRSVDRLTLDRKSACLAAAPRKRQMGAELREVADQGLKSGKVQHTTPYKRS